MNKNYLHGLLVNTPEGYGIMTNEYIVYKIQERENFELQRNGEWKAAHCLYLPYEGWDILDENENSMCIWPYGIPARKEIEQIECDEELPEIFI